MAFSGPGDQQGGCDREHRKGLVKIPKDKLTISPVFALDSPTCRCSAHPHSQGVGVRPGPWASWGQAHMCMGNDGPGREGWQHSKGGGGRQGDIE